MTDDMWYNLKLPTVGELTFPQWQEWLVHYNALLLKRGRRIEQLEAALRALKAMHHAGGIDDLQERDDRTYSMVCEALEGKDSLV